MPSVTAEGSSHGFFNLQRYDICVDWRQVSNVILTGFVILFVMIIFLILLSSCVFFYTVYQLLLPIEKS